MANYYDIDDILMEEELMSVVFWVAANGVALKQTLLNKERSQNTWKEVQADAVCVDLRSRCPCFYELGCKVAPLIGDRSIGTFLLYTFTGRYKEALSKAHSASFSSPPKFLPLLTKEESQLFEAARSSMMSYKKWRVGGSRLEKASILGRKRKPIGQLHEPSL